VKILEEVGGYGLGRFSLHWDYLPPEINEKIHLVSGSSAPVVEPRLFAPVHEVLVYLREHKTLKHCAAFSPVQEFVRRADLKQVAQESRVQEVELRALDNPLAEVLMVRPQERHDQAGLEHREPPPGRGVGDTAVGGHPQEIERLSAPAGTQSDKPVEGLEVANIDDASHLPLEVVLEVTGQPITGRKVLVVYLRVEAGEECFQKPLRRRLHVRGSTFTERLEVNGLSTLELGQRERKQVKHRTPASQGL